MTDPTAAPPPATPTASASDFIATFAAVIAAIALLLVFDTGIAKVDRDANRSHATSEYQQGESLSVHGKIAEAIDHFRTAASLDRDKPGYSVALAQAILTVGNPEDAEQLLLPVLERNATDGATNLAMARVLVREGRIEEAKSYYHRAIYGLWPSDAERNRATARFELIDLLAKTGAKQDLLAELLPIQDAAPNDTALRKRIAHLFVVAGSPARASEIFRDVLRQNSRDADAYVGLADAALALGNYPTARADLTTAARLAPDDSAIQKRIVLTDSVIAIDPTQRGLGLDEQIRRSRNLVEMTIASARKCLGTAAPEVAANLDSVSRTLVAPSTGVSRSQAIDVNISLAVALWRMRREKCATAAPKDEEA
ncbi:MAG TPA: tetratricopeptide repeat protein, partial [Gemmatimonadaceae bacterium]|nr:tetratricopeptide repeat protein [Gemmatimonadaceae bacterium]